MQFETQYQSLDAVTRYVVDHYLLFEVGFPVEFIKIDGFTTTAIAKRLKPLCEEPVRLRLNSKLVHEMESKLKAYDPEINIYQKDSGKQLRFYILKQPSDIPDIYNIIEYINQKEGLFSDEEEEEEGEHPANAESAELVDSRSCTEFRYSGPITTEWEPVKNHPAYQIRLVLGRAHIRDENDEVKHKMHNKGYETVRMDGQTYLLHKIIAEQYIPHNDLCNVIDHIDRERTNNFIWNLRWTTVQQNNLNRTSSKGVVYTYVDELPENAIPVTCYQDREIRDVYFADNEFYKFTGVQFKIMPKHHFKSGYYVNTRDVNNKVVAICYNVWKRQ